MAQSTAIYSACPSSRVTWNSLSIARYLPTLYIALQVFEGGGGSPFLPLPKIFTLALLIMATIMMSTTTPSSLLPLAKASGRCPPSLIRDEQIIEGGVFEMACLKALDLTSQGELELLFFLVVWKFVPEGQTLFNVMVGI